MVADSQQLVINLTARQLSHHAVREQCLVIYGRFCPGLLSSLASSQSEKLSNIIKNLGDYKKLQVKILMILEI